mmetsp:Transcript_26805/g.61710  ORF Transcript_26805/g.61710 Transcript_26805/m.61710 type:complete len:158 (-) Transcript_26805:15-488(-)
MIGRPTNNTADGSENESSRSTTSTASSSGPNSFEESIPKTSTPSYVQGKFQESNPSPISHITLDSMDDLGNIIGYCRSCDKSEDKSKSLPLFSWSRDVVRDVISTIHRILGERSELKKRINGVIKSRKNRTKSDFTKKTSKNQDTSSKIFEVCVKKL